MRAFFKRIAASAVNRLVSSYDALESRLEAHRKAGAAGKAEKKARALFLGQHGSVQGFLRSPQIKYLVDYELNAEQKSDFERLLSENENTRVDGVWMLGTHARDRREKAAAMQILLGLSFDESEKVRKLAKEWFSTLLK